MAYELLAGAANEALGTLFSNLAENRRQQRQMAIDAAREQGITAAQEMKEQEKKAVGSLADLIDAYRSALG